MMFVWDRDGSQLWGYVHPFMRYFNYNNNSRVFKVCSILLENKIELIYYDSKISFRECRCSDKIRYVGIIDMGVRVRTS